MKEKYYKSKDLYIIPFCNYSSVTRTKNLIGYYIATKTRAGIIKDSKFVLITKKNIMVDIASSYHRDSCYFADNNYIPLPLYAKNLPDKIPYSLIEKFEKDINDYYLAHKDELLQEQSKAQNSDDDELCC